MQTVWSPFKCPGTKQMRYPVSAYENPVRALMRQGLRDRVFPGAVLLVGKGDRRLFFEAFGRANLFANTAMTRSTVFDLASLTKPLATALAVARLVDDGVLDLDRAVAGYLPELRGSDKAAITARQLLRHRGGLPGHRLFYMALRSQPAPFRHDSVMDLLQQVSLSSSPGSETVYSDLGYMLLCRLVERLSGMRLDRFLGKAVYGPMGIGDLFFVSLTDERRPIPNVAATELCPVRCRLLIGEVHDDNAWYAGGIDGHAGLFGAADAVFRLLRRLVDEAAGRIADPLFSGEILAEMLNGDRRHRFSLGFDRPSAEKSSAGRYFSKASVGHLGFTGCSFWLDPERDMTVVLLTNRVHPFRWHNRLIEFRPKIHDTIVEHFGI